MCAEDASIAVLVSFLNTFVLFFSEIPAYRQAGRVSGSEQGDIPGVHIKQNIKNVTMDKRTINTPIPFVFLISFFMEIGSKRQLIFE